MYRVPHTTFPLSLSLSFTGCVGDNTDRQYLGNGRVNCTFTPTF